MNKMTYVAHPVCEYPLRPCYRVTVDADHEDGSAETYEVMLVPTNMPGWTYDAYVSCPDEGGEIAYVHAVTPGVETPKPEDYALAAVRAVAK